MDTILIELGALLRSTPTTVASAGEVAAWHEAKAELLTRIADHHATPQEDVLRLTGQARAARRRAVRARSGQGPGGIFSGDSCLDHTAWGCPTLPAQHTQAA